MIQQDLIVSQVPLGEIEESSFMAIREKDNHSGVFLFIKKKAQVENHVLKLELV